MANFSADEYFLDIGYIKTSNIYTVIYTVYLRIMFSLDS